MTLKLDPEEKADLARSWGRKVLGAAMAGTGRGEGQAERNGGCD